MLVLNVLTKCVFITEHFIFEPPVMVRFTLCRKLCVAVGAMFRKTTTLP